LAKELGIKPEHVVGLLNAPADLKELLEPIPDGVEFRTSAKGKLDVVVAFFIERRDFEKRLETTGTTIFSDGGLCVAWLKGLPRFKRR
jgi:hypothetical protein